MLLVDTHRSAHEELLFRCQCNANLQNDPLFLNTLGAPQVDGHSYERSAIETWIQYNKTSPATGQKLRAFELLPNLALKTSIDWWLEQRELKQKAGLALAAVTRCFSPAQAPARSVLVFAAQLSFRSRIAAAL